MLSLTGQPYRRLDSDKISNATKLADLNPIGGNE